MTLDHNAENGTTEQNIDVRAVRGRHLCCDSILQASWGKALDACTFYWKKTLNI